MDEPGAPGQWTFAFVDLAGFTALTQTHGDVAAADLATAFAEVAEEQLGPGDRLVKSIGDAVLLATPGPREGLGVVRRLIAACNELEGFPVARAGLHHGPAVERGDDMFGAAVNLTARVAGQASGAQVLATAEVAAAAEAGHLQVSSLGAFELRNIAEPVELFEIGLMSESTPTVDPVCRMQVRRGSAAGHLRHEGRDLWFCSLECVAAFAASPDRFLR